METVYNKKSTSTFSKVVTILCLFISIASLILSILPCIGFFALFPSSIIGVISLLLLYFNYDDKTTRYLTITSLLISLGGVSMALYQRYFFIPEVTNQVGNSIGKGISNSINNAEIDTNALKEVLQDIQDDRMNKNNPTK